jgi:hypothetical protein
MFSSDSVSAVVRDCVTQTEDMNTDITKGTENNTSLSADS